MTRTADRGDAIEGVVSARQCGCCGHHEIGIITADGEFVALQPGMRVVVTGQAASPNSITDN